MSEQLAIISEVGIGSRDVGTPVLWFTVHISESLAALIVLTWDEAFQVLKQVHEVHDLNGKPCWVEADGQLIDFLRLWKP